jgi:hypothetical protein
MAVSFLAVQALAFSFRMLNHFQFSDLTISHPLHFYVLLNMLPAEVTPFGLKFL